MAAPSDCKPITGAGGVIAAVAPASLAATLGLQPGDTVVAVGAQRLRDVIDYRFAIAEAQITLHIRTADGTTQTHTVTKDPDTDLGLTFADPLFDRLRTCTNKCPFCFLTQMPKGFRKTLYLKDDDYRLSFLYHNFVTFTNLSEADWERIAEQRLSPLHISVHATDPFWRAVMLGKGDLPDVCAQIRRLGALGITVHTQLVICPGANDGAVLEQSLADLVALYPTVQSIAVVPVGLTKYRFDGSRPSTLKAAIQVHEQAEWREPTEAGQPPWEAVNESAPLHDPALGFCARLGAATAIPLRCFTGAEAATIIDQIELLGFSLRPRLGRTLVYPSDEFYLLAERRLPPAKHYDAMPQYGNGVGMVRDFLDMWARERRRLPVRLPHPTSLGLVCGTLMAPLMAQVAVRLNEIEGLTAQVVAVPNQFFGETVTVSGLLTAQDVLPALIAAGCARALLPRVMFDYQGERTLDDYDLPRIAAATGLPVACAGDPAELVRYVRALTRTDGH